nr:ABC transporter ATP-binding protein [uncultured Flavobacterium sp.]
MGEVLIKVDHVSKKFAKDLKKSLLYGLSDVFSGITRKKQDKSLRKDEFWAVKDISFEVRRGECLGLIGHNGAGKSTLLKILNGLIAPDEGSVTMYGKVGALIELGAGFNPILTGRENIYNNGAIIGFSKQEIEAKYEEIVAFAELEEFIDMPVQNYSSGMKVRLGFAIAAQMEPDILLIDEVLAVGDIGFRAKCYDAITTIFKNSCVIFVSHSMPQVSRMCDLVLNLNKGTCEHIGLSSQGIRIYNNSFKTEITNAIVETIKLVEFTINGKNDDVKINYGEDICLEFSFNSSFIIKEPSLNIHIIDTTQQYIYQVNNERDKVTLKDIEIGDNKIKLKLKKIQLNPENYSFSVALRDSKDREFYSWYHGIGQFEILGDFLGESQYQGLVEWK